MTKYRLTEERRSQSEVTLTGYMLGNETMTTYDGQTYTNPTMELNSNGNGLTMDIKNERSNSCACSEKGRFFCLFVTVDNIILIIRVT